MNYLAHLFLAEPTPESQIGNLLGDFIKGKIDDFSPIYSSEIIQGIKTHQKIDIFTDHHPIFKISKQRLNQNNRRFSGVIIDIYYDHFLAKNWLIYAQQDLDVFVVNIYQTLEDYKFLLPEKLQKALPYMIQEDWLGSYRYLEGINKTFCRLAQRIKRTNNLACAIDDLIENYSGLEQDFLQFFPQLIDYVKEYKFFQDLKPHH